LHLVEGLDGGEAGDGAGAALLAGQLRLGALFFGFGELLEHGLEAGGFGHEASPTRRRLRKAMRSTQARAAPPPLSPSLIRARAQAWSSSSVVRMPLPMARPRRPSSIRPAAD